MADQNVMRSFMMKLGFKVDQQQERHFDRSVRETTKNVIGLKTAVAGAVAVAATGVVKLASDFESLYYQAKRSRDSARNVQAFGYAASQLGSSIGEARSAAQGLAKQLRENPVGTEGLLSRIGVQTRDVNGDLKGSVTLLRGVGQQLQDMPIAKAEAWKRSLQIPDNLFLAMRSGQMGEYFRQGRQMLSGVDYGRLTKDSHQFMQQLRRIRTQVYQIGLLSVSEIEGNLGGNLKDVGDWLRDNGPEIAQTVSTWVSGAVNFGEATVSALKKVNEATDGWLSTIAKVYATYRAITLLTGTGGLVSKLLSGGGALAKGSGGRTLGRILLATRAGPIGGAAAFGYAVGTGINYGINKYLPSLGRSIGDSIGSLLGWFGIGPGAESDGDGGSTGGDSGKYSKASGDIVLQRRRQIAKAFPSLTPQQRIGVLANMQAESGFNKNSVGDGGTSVGLFQFHGVLKDMLLNRTGADNVNGTTVAEQLQFMKSRMQSEGTWSGLKKQQTKAQAASFISNNFEKPGSSRASREAEAQQRGNLASQYKVEVNVNMQGGNNAVDDIERAARRGANSAIRENARATVRNTKPVAQ